MTPGKYNMVCPQGSTFNQELTYSINAVNVDLTGYSARMHIRATYTSTTPTASLTTENGKIALGGSAGTITVNIPSSETTNFVAKEYVYDLELVSPSLEVTRLIEGKFIVTPEVTK
jgi:hypothetical protein